MTLLTALAQSNHELGELDNARKGYDAALTADPEYAPALAGRAILAFDADTVDSLASAVADLERAVLLSRDPDLNDNLELARRRRNVLVQAAAAAIP